MELTVAGQVFLHHARSILWQVEGASEAARRAARSAKAVFTVGFLTGYEIEWLREILEIPLNELHRTEVVIHSPSSLELTQGLLRGKMDLALLRPDKQMPGLMFKLLIKGLLFVLLPRSQRLASREAILLDDIAGEPFIEFSRTYAPVLQAVIGDYDVACGHFVGAPQVCCQPMQGSFCRLPLSACRSRAMHP